MKLLVFLPLYLSSSNAFLTQKYRFTFELHASRSRSVVEDPEGPTPVLEPPEIETVDPNDIEGLRELRDESEIPSPVPHQPWRKGDTDGCEDPITAPWRLKAEQLIYDSVELAGGKVLDITWFLTTLLVTLDEEVMPDRNLFKDRGPVIDIRHPTNPVYKDPTDPNPTDIWDDEDDILYQKYTEDERTEHEDRLRNNYVKVSPDDEFPDESHIPDHNENHIDLYRNIETRVDIADQVAGEAALMDLENEQPMDMNTISIDTQGLSTIAHTIMEALEPHEDELRVLDRHELVLTSPNPAPDVLETQKQFDAYRDAFVVVETQDPFESNRTLKGQLVDRNPMDLLLNIQGRLVTVPLVFVKCVRLPPGHLDLDEEELAAELQALEEEDMLQEE